MKRKQQKADFDDLDVITELVRKRQRDPLKTLEAEYDIGLGYLWEYIRSGGSRTLGAHEAELAIHLARHYLFNYFFGCLALKFSAPYQRRSVTPRQEIIEKAIGYLADIECARSVMTEWFEAALTGKLHRTTQKPLHGGFTLSPWAWLYRVLGRLVLSDTLERLSWFKSDGYRAPKFGLSGYYIMFAKTGKTTAAEFASLMTYLRQLMSTRDLYFIGNLEDAVEVLTQARMTVEQRQEFLSLAISWLDVKRFPNHDWREDIEDPVEGARMAIERFELGKRLTWLLSLPLRSRRVQESIRRHREFRLREGLTYRQQVTPEQETRQRRVFVAAMVGKLAFRSEQPMEVIEQAGRAGLEAAGVSSQELVERAQSAALRRAVEQLPVMRLVQDARSQDSTWWGLTNDVKEALNNSGAELASNVLEYLLTRVADDEILENHLMSLEKWHEDTWSSLEVRRRPIWMAIWMAEREPFRGKTETWVWEVLETVPKVRYRAVQQLVQRLKAEKRPGVLRAAMTLHRNLVKRSVAAIAELEMALYEGAKKLLLDSETPFDPTWVLWILGLADSRERLVEVLRPLRERFGLGDRTLGRREQLFLEALAGQVEMLDEPDAAVLAAGWLLDPNDWLETGQSLAQRGDEAIYLLEAPRDEQQGQERIVAVLERAVEKAIQGSDVLTEKGRYSSWGEPIEHERPLETVAKASKTLWPADLAVPLLERLLNLKPRPPYGGYWNLDYVEQRRTIHAEALRSLASLDPLTTESILCLVKQIFLTRTGDTMLDSVASQAFVQDDLLSLLIHDVDERAVDSLVALIQRGGRGPWLNDRGDLGDLKGMGSDSVELSRYCLEANEQELLCVLQALANVTSLSETQQEWVWEVYHRARGELIKSLCLLVLGRQRPISERTKHELLRLLRQSPLVSGLKRMTAGLSSTKNDDLLLRQSLVLQISDNLLRSASDDPTVKQFQEEIERAMTRSASISRAVIERRFEGGVSQAGFKAPVSVLRGKRDDAEHRILEPSDTAYGLLWERIVSHTLIR